MYACMFMYVPHFLYVCVYTKWIGRIDTSKVTKMMFGEKNYNNRDKPTIVTDAWLHFTASGKFPLLTSLDLFNNKSLLSK